MTREEALRRLSEHRAELERFGVRSLDLFGSVARGDSGPRSDVDLLVEFDKPVGLFHFFRVQRRMEAILGRPVDLVMKDAIKRQLRARILAESVSASQALAPPHRGHPGRRWSACSGTGGHGPLVFHRGREDRGCRQLLLRRVGEPARHVPEDVVPANPDLPWPEMRAMRNVVVHEYFGVTQETLWKTAREDPPALVERLRRLLAEPEP